MLFYNMKKGVYLIKGAEKHCIYNSSDGNIYHINSDTLDLLESINTSNNVDQLQTEEKKLLKEFENADLIEPADKRKPFPDIKSEAASKNNINFAWIEVTQRCNLQCVHCYESSHPNIEGEMSYDDFVMLADKLIKFGIKQIQFIGGEPLVLGDRLKKMIEYSSDKFEFIEVYTNGTLVNEEWVKFLKSKNINVAISAYSYDKEQHDKVTQVKGSFKKTDRTIKLLDKYNLNYRVSGVEMKEIDIGDQSSSVYKINKMDLVRLSGRANFSLYDDSMLKRKLITKDSFKYPKQIEEIRRMISGHNCFSRDLYIDFTLNVFPCVMERRFMHGNIRHKELEEIIKSDILHLTKDFIEGCNQCEFRYFCFDCRPDSFGADKLAKPWFCTYEPAAGQWTDPDKYIESLKTKHKENKNEKIRI